jgi:tyrosine-specific transport protein
MSISKVIGGALLVSGTTIGAGLLGLPTTCAFMGFSLSILIFIITSMMMLCTGIFFVDVTCDIKKRVNIISMAEKTIGRWGMMVSWISYLLLMYSLISLYIAASGPLFQQASLYFFDIPLSDGLSHFVLILLFAWVIYLGTYGVDIINRVLMVGLVLSYILLASTLPAHIDFKYLEHLDFRAFLYPLPFVITGFGYHIIIPTLGSYMNYNRKLMIYAVVIGSAVALLINIYWQFLVLGVIPLDLFAKVWKQGIPITQTLAQVVASPLISIGVYLFSFFAILTSFLGVGLSLSDFLIDGLKIKKGWEGRLLAIALTFLPPLLFVNVYPRGFMLALEYGGAFVAVILIFIPSVMVWKLKGHLFYRSSRGKGLITVVILFSMSVIIVNVLNRWDFFTKTLESIGGLKG